MSDSAVPKSPELESFIKRSEAALFRNRENWNDSFRIYFRSLYSAFAEAYQTSRSLDDYSGMLDLRLPAEILQVAFRTRWIQDKLVKSTARDFDLLKRTYDAAALPWDDLAARIALIFKLFDLEEEILECSITCAEAAYGRSETQVTMDRVATTQHPSPAKLEDQAQPATSTSSESGRDGPTGDDLLTWEDIEIVFLDEGRVQVFKLGKPQESENYAVMGFSDGRTGNPKRAWLVLRELAENNGTLNVRYRQNEEAKANPRANREDAQRDVAASRKHGFAELAKRVQEIRRVLQHRWKISDDPIPYVQGRGYVAVFKISCHPSNRE